MFFKFKTIFAIFILVFLFTAASFAQPPMKSRSLTFKWDRNNDQITKGYNLYQATDPNALTKENFDYGQKTSVKVNKVDILQPDSSQSTVTYTLTDVAAGHWYWVVTAYNENGTESEPSEIADKIVDYQIVPSPKNFHIYILIDINTSNQ